MISSRSAALVVMAKQPTAGSTKTRLSPLISKEAAADLYEAFLLDALDIARSVGGVETLVAIHPPTAGEYFARVAPDLAQIEQIGGSLAERLSGVLADCSLRYDKVVAINSDSPTLPPAFIAEAFDWLDIDAVDVVIGPCEDGGYYLIGWRTPHPSLIREVTMSTPHVLRDTLSAA